MNTEQLWWYCKSGSNSYFTSGDATHTFFQGEGWLNGLRVVVGRWNHRPYYRVYSNSAGPMYLGVGENSSVLKLYPELVLEISQLEKVDQYLNFSKADLGFWGDKELKKTYVYRKCVQNTLSETFSSALCGRMEWMRHFRTKVWNLSKFLHT